MTLTDEIAQATTDGKLDVVQSLLASNEELVDTFDANGWTPLHLAAHYGYASIAEILLQYGAGINTRSHNDLNNTPLHAATVNVGTAAVVRLLLDMGADVNAMQHGGWTALQAAAQNGDVENVQLLIDAGADLYARNDQDQTALVLAMAKNHATIVDILRRYDH